MIKIAIGLVAGCVLALAAPSTRVAQADVTAQCAVSIDLVGEIITLLDDCTTDHTLTVPNGWTLDGEGFTITAEDPATGHFLGAVVQGLAGTEDTHVTDLGVTVDGLATVCDAGADRLRGILFDGTGGSITNSSVTGIAQGPDGCQEGNAIEVRNAPFDDTGDDLLVTISVNFVSGYQKTGILANGSVGATITNNVIEGLGPVDFIAQNGIQIGFGATAVIRGNTITGNDYTPVDTQSCGLLLFEADGVKASKNEYDANEFNVCNFGKGGGNFNPN